MGAMLCISRELCYIEAVRCAMRVYAFWVLLLAPCANAQTVFEVDRHTDRLLKEFLLEKAADALRGLTSRHMRFSAIRVCSTAHKDELAALAKALRTDFDGKQGGRFASDGMIWTVADGGHRVFLSASLENPKTVLLADDIRDLKGMLAFELLALIRKGELEKRAAQQKARNFGIDMRVVDGDDGERKITFFGQTGDELRAKRLTVIEPMELAWNF